MSASDDHPVCEICGGFSFQIVKNSILIQHYSFITAKNLKQCSTCGAKYIICSNCGSVVNRVHLALDIYGLKNECPFCGVIDKEISKWFANYSKS